MVRDPRRGGKEEEKKEGEEDQGIMVSEVWQCFTIEEGEKEEEGAKRTDILLAISRRIYLTIVLSSWVKTFIEVDFK